MLQSTNEFQNSGFGGFPFGGFGGGGIGGFGLVGLIGLLDRDRNRCGDKCNEDVLNAIIMNKLGDVQNDVREAQAGITEGISGLKDTTQNQTLFLQNALHQISLADLQAHANTKDTVQASTALLVKQLCDTASEMQKGFCSVKEKVDVEGDRTRALINDINREQLNRQLSDAKNEVIELRNEGRGRDRARETEINISQSVNQQQAQAQLQSQFNSLFGVISNLANDLQLIKQGSVIFNAGTMAASGNQTANNTKVA